MGRRMWYKTLQKTMKMILGIFSGLPQMVALVLFKEFYNICHQENFDSCLLSPITTNSLCMYVRTYVCTYVCMYVCMYVQMYIRTTYVCMYVCMHA